MQKEKFLDRSVKSFDFLMESHAYVRARVRISRTFVVVSIRTHIGCDFLATRHFSVFCLQKGNPYGIYNRKVRLMILQKGCPYRTKEFNFTRLNYFLSRRDNLFVELQSFLLLLNPVGISFLFINTNY